MLIDYSEEPAFLGHRQQARRGGNEGFKARPDIRGAFCQSTPVPASASMKNDAILLQVVVERPIVAGIPSTRSLPIVLPMRSLPD
jgi:hypothetical protein